MTPEQLGTLTEAAASAADDVAEYRSPRGTLTTWDERRVGRMLARDPVIGELVPLAVSEIAAQDEIIARISEQLDHAHQVGAALAIDLHAAEEASAAFVSASAEDYWQIDDEAQRLRALASAVAQRIAARCHTQSATTDDYTLLEYNQCAGGTHCSMCPVARGDAAILEAYRTLEATP